MMRTSSRYAASNKATQPAHERCFITTRRKGRMAVGLAFPNSYAVGMSNLGFQVVYRLFSEVPGVVCERFFNTPPARPTSVESGRPLSSCELIAFSLSFENDYIAVLDMLARAGIPRRRTERSDSDPMVIAGGVAAFLNPEPIADFFDIFILGEAEEVLGEFMQLVMSEHAAGRHRLNTVLSRLASCPGIYVPSAYNITYDESGHIADRKALPGFSDRVVCRSISDINRFPSSSAFITSDTEFSDMAIAEVSRGCPRSCRFCAVGTVYRPYRFRNANRILEDLEPFLAEHCKIGLLGAAVSDYPKLIDLLKEITARKAPVTIASLRADSLTEEIVSLLHKSGHTTFTIAPEAGSQRLRDAIGKRLSEEEIYSAVRALSRCRVPRIKLYYMIGLPTEDDEDVQDIIGLTKAIKHIYYSEGRGEKVLHHITLSISPFVPKPFTALQWHPYEQVAMLKQKLRTIRQGLKKERKVTVTSSLPKWGYVQTFLSRGDRRAGKILEKVLEYKHDWFKAFRDDPVNTDYYVYRQRSLDEKLPWDFIDNGTDKARLWQEYCEAVPHIRLPGRV